MGQENMVLVQKLEILGKGKSAFSLEAKGCELAALLYGSLDRAGSSTNEYDKGRTHPRYGHLAYRETYMYGCFPL